MSNQQSLALTDLWVWMVMTGVLLGPVMSAAGPGVEARPLPPREGREVPVTTVQELEQAVRDARPGDTILVADGTYRLERSLWFEDKAHVTLRGASGDPEKVVLRGAGWEGGRPGQLVNIRTSDDIIIAHLTFTEVHDYGIKVEPYPNPPNPTNIHVYDCRFRDIAKRAIKGTASADRRHVVGGSVRFCHFESTRLPDPTWPFGGNYVSAIDMMYLEDWAFSDNVFRNIKGVAGGGRGAIFVWNQSRNITVERNVFIDCDRAIAFGNPSEPTGYEAGSLHVYDGVIRNNFVVVGTNPHTRNTKGIELVWVDNVDVHHNTVYAPDARCYAIHAFPADRVSRLHVANNLLRGRFELHGDVRAEGNFVGELEGWFVEAGEGDLRLTAEGLQAVRTGVAVPGVAEDIFGRRRAEPPRVGAWEG